MGVAPGNLCLSNFRDLQQIASHLSTVWTMGVVISVNPRAPPRRGPDLLWIPGTSSEKGMVNFLVSARWVLPP